MTKLTLYYDNYDIWSSLMESYLLAQDLGDIVQAATEPPNPEDDVEYRAWTKKNAAALYAIQSRCSEEILVQIKGINSARIVWDALATMCGPQSSTDSPSDSPSDSARHLHSNSSRDSPSDSPRDSPSNSSRDSPSDSPRDSPSDSPHLIEGDPLSKH